MVAYGKTADVFTNELLQRTYGGKLTVLSEIGSRKVAEIPFSG
jgi:manganese/zinc/iron transport system ATP- binding protein